MIHLLIDEGSPLSELSQFVEPVTITAGNGRLVGVFIPRLLAHEKHQNGKGGFAECIVLNHQVQKKEKGYTTKEVFERLLAITEEESLRKRLRASIRRFEEMGSVVPGFVGS